ncbi:glycine cleavage system T protein [Catenulispora acidiphila DSM 44928]|uniref:aminomethyltransferase n=1 Tax=Catenulispora acidiphila (strain DSM 44928 / JCM 14897 / NBRC 102108 / NRRL B-24433 / ID139908) TaxID=479433 RepID=C7QD46_CATAD|nr:glycine cleavage system aminomethyltransferase GcvT [Catenulispora acidiphila]ACU70756.1 glycine cleavage system T protein [Catenulispora acidiphila DSM 44928]
MTSDPLTSPLHARHVALGAKMSDFGGWDMPIEYSRTGGVLKEHAAVREQVGVFDVSHLGKASVTGPGAAAFVNSVLANDLQRIEDGQAQYTLCCDDATGGVVDDLIAYLNGPEDVFLIPNAANTSEVVRRLREAAPEGVTVQNRHRDFGVLAVQGPKSAAVLAELGLPTDHDYMSFTVASFENAPLTVCRTGYTGEHGYELVAPWDKTEALWDALQAAGEEFGIRPCGLGARDTLRTEMGYPLHGQDLSMEITPNMARAGWAVGWKKPAFWGREVLLAEREAGAKRLLRGIRAVDRAIPRAHMVVNDADGKQIGEVTSGTFSPTLREGIGLALLDREYTEGDTVYLDVRGKAAAFTVVKPPFVDVRTRG